MRSYLFLALVFSASVATEGMCQAPASLNSEELVAVLDTVFQTEQEPIRKRDSLIALYGVDHEAVETQQRIYKQNHAVNEKIVRDILDNHGWPARDVIGERGSMIISNVLQHASNEIRIKYLPMMQQAVAEGKLEPRFLARAEDRLATDRGELQRYGGQMKYYPETKSFNVWPVFDPVNINKRRAAIGLGPIEAHLKRRFDFEWNLEEQIERTRAFEAAVKQEQNQEQ